ncbi:MAG: SDR family oxidoreductase [Planctomycetota bacterium]
MKVLITGNDGYIGCILTPLLLEHGHEVVGLDSKLFHDCEFVDPSAGSEPKIPTLDVDVRTIDVPDLEGFDAIIHLAGISNDPLGDLNPECTYDINHKASVRLAELAKEAGVPRFLHSSSCSLYGAAGDDLVNENASFNPVTPYGISKVRVEQDVSPLADDNFSPTFLRNSTAYGCSPRLRADLVVNNLVGYAYTTGRVLLKSDGTPWRPLVHVEDISRAFLAVLHAPRDRVHNQAFNVGSSQENYRIREVAEIVSDVVPGSRIEFANGAGPDKRCYRVDCDKILSMLPESRPHWTVRRGAEELYDAYQRHGLTLEEFESSRYLRIKHVRELQGQGKLDSQLRWTNGQG